MTGLVLGALALGALAAVACRRPPPIPPPGWRLSRGIGYVPPAYGSAYEIDTAALVQALKTRHEARP